MKDFPLQRGLDIQEEQLANWKPKLNSDLYEDLVVYANTDKENWSDGHDVKRGVTLDNFIKNWGKEIPFILEGELEKMYKDLDGEEINGLIFVGQQAKDGQVHLSFKANVPIMKDVNIFCTPFLGNINGIAFSIGDNDIVATCKPPTSHEEFAEFKKFYIGQLVVVQGKFATIEQCNVDNINKTYTVDGFLVPKQTISFESYDEWNSIEDCNGNSILDCQFQLDEDLQFQYVDYNYNVDAEENESRINLNDTLNLGFKTHTHRDYRACENVELVSELHPLTSRILDQFYIKYFEHNEFGDDESIIILDDMIRDTHRHLK